MKVLVTGAEGYIGAVLVPYLAERGHRVTAVDTGFYREGYLFHDGESLPAVHTRDVRRLTHEDLRGHDAVVHLGELSNDPAGDLIPEATERINHRGTVRLAQLCVEAGIERFVQMSSCSVYGVADEEVVNETSALHPQTAYARCKEKVEREVSALASHRFTPTFLRNATAFGASPRMRFDLVVNNLSGLAWTRKQLLLTSDGTPWRPLVHILDISQAIDLTLRAPRERVHAEVLNVGGRDANFTVAEIARALGEVFDGCPVVLGELGADRRSYRVSFDKIHRVLPDFRARFGLRDGAVQLRRLFERIRLTREAFEARPYHRLHQLKHLLESGQLDGELFWATTPVAQLSERVE